VSTVNTGEKELETKKKHRRGPLEEDTYIPSRDENVGVGTKGIKYPKKDVKKVSAAGKRQSFGNAILKLLGGEGQAAIGP